MMKNLPGEIQLIKALLTSQYSYTYFYTIFWKDSVVYKLVCAIYYTVYIHGVKDKQKEKIYGLASLCIDNPLAQLLAEIICSSCSIMLFSHFPKNIWGLNHLEKVLLLYNEKHSAGKVTKTVYNHFQLKAFTCRWWINHFSFMSEFNVS